MLHTPSPFSKNLCNSHACSFYLTTASKQSAGLPSTTGMTRSVGNQSGARYLARAAHFKPNPRCIEACRQFQPYIPLVAACACASSCSSNLWTSSHLRVCSWTELTRTATGRPWTWQPPAVSPEQGRSPEGGCRDWVPGRPAQSILDDRAQPKAPGKRPAAPSLQNDVRLPAQSTIRDGACSGQHTECSPYIGKPLIEQEAPGGARIPSPWCLGSPHASVARGFSTTTPITGWVAMLQAAPQLTALPLLGECWVQHAAAAPPLVKRHPHDASTSACVSHVAAPSLSTTPHGCPGSPPWHLKQRLIGPRG